MGCRSFRRSLGGNGGRRREGLALTGRRIKSVECFQACSSRIRDRWRTDRSWVAGSEAGMTFDLLEVLAATRVGQRPCTRARARLLVRILLGVEQGSAKGYLEFYSKRIGDGLEVNLGRLEYFVLVLLVNLYCYFYKPVQSSEA